MKMPYFLPAVHMLLLPTERQYKEEFSLKLTQRALGRTFKDTTIPKQ